MKNFILLFSFIISVSLTAQTKEDLFKVTENVFNNSVEGDYEKVFNETYPAVFDLVTKEQLLQAMEMMMNNPNFNIEFDDIEPNIEISEIIEKDGNKYASVGYDMIMRMKFQENFSGDLNMMKEMMQQQSPGADVTIDDENKVLELKKRSYSYAISDDKTDHQWKLLNNENNYQSFIDQYMPEDVKKKLDE